MYMPKNLDVGSCVYMRSESQVADFNKRMSDVDMKAGGVGHAEVRIKQKMTEYGPEEKGMQTKMNGRCARETSSEQPNSFVKDHGTASPQVQPAILVSFNQ